MNNEYLMKIRHEWLFEDMIVFGGSVGLIWYRPNDERNQIVSENRGREGTRACLWSSLFRRRGGEEEKAIEENEEGERVGGKIFGGPGWIRGGGVVERRMYRRLQLHPSF
ncbi:unnamed protein product [Spirodela intermedia]|uniref:Uncharacterized protein n=1 Tax=Spirodela intermedia TaxID=51605 RepID=A0A7I8L876_SPIIN|nr:unnamed protein product [Spirodela intermedia]